MGVMKPGFQALSALFLTSIFAILGPSQAVAQSSAELRLGMSPQGSLSAGGGTEGRAAWSRLFGLAAGLVQDGSEVGVLYKLDWGPTEYLHVTATLRDPMLRESVRKALGEDEERAAARDLLPWDDILLEAEVKIPTGGGAEKRRKREALSSISRSVNLSLGDPANLLSSSSWVGTKASGASWLSHLDSKLRRGNEGSSALRDFLSGLDAGSQEEREGMRFLVNRALIYAAQASEEKYILSFSGRYRSADTLVGQDEKGASLKLAVNPEHDPDMSSANVFATALETVLMEEPERTHTFDLEASYSEKSAITGLSPDSLNVEEFRELKASATWSTNLGEKRRQGLEPGFESRNLEDMLPGASNVLSISYMRPNEDFANERIVIKDTLTLRTKDGQAFPLTLTWANRDELVEGDIVTANFGVSFNWAKAD